MAIDSAPDGKLKRADLNDVDGWEKGWKSWGMWRSNAERCSKEMRVLEENGMNFEKVRHLPIQHIAFTSLYSLTIQLAYRMSERGFATVELNRLARSATSGTRWDGRNQMTRNR